jgi:hypothetical protein
LTRRGDAVKTISPRDPVEGILALHENVRMRSAGGGLLLVLAGCSADCARQGCDALAQRAAQNGPGVAGVVASESDLVADGCAECSFDQATVEIWPTESPVTSADDARMLTAASGTPVTVSANPRFAEPLEQGNYLVCVRPNCVAVEVRTETITVNVKRRNGPTSFFLAASSGAALTEDYGFEVGY